MLVPSLLLLLVPLGPTPAPQLSEAAFTRNLTELQAADVASGMAVAVYRDGKPLYAHAFGLADVQLETPYTTEVAFEIGSLSKQFTAAAILKLVERGKLALEDPIGTRLPDLPEAWRAVTVEQLLHHVSGIPDYEAIAGYDDYDTPHAPEDIVAVAAGQRPAFAPGTRFEYSNTGYFLLSRIVEALDAPLDAFLQREFFTPLGMRSTWTSARPEGVAVATGYHARTGTLTPHPPIAWSATLGAGGIVSTLGDLSLWDEALYGERILPAALLAKLWQPAHLADGREIPYGAGWFTSELRGLEHLSHSGQTNGFTCDYLRFPAQHLTVLASANAYGSGVGELARAAAVHFVPGLSYAALPVPEDPDPECTAEHWMALRQAVLGEGELDLLGSGMRRFAREPGYGKQREALRPRLEGSRSFRFVRMGPFEGSADTEEFLYRQADDAGETFWTLRVAEGLLVSLNWERE